MLLLWKELLLDSLAADHLRRSQSSISLSTVQLCLLASWNPKGDECRSNLVQEIIKPRLDCRSVLAGSLNVGNGHSTLAAPQSFHSISFSREHRVALLSKVKQLLSRHLVSHWSWSLDTNELSTKYIEDPESHIARPFRLKSLFVSLMRTGSPP